MILDRLKQQAAARPRRVLLPEAALDPRVVEAAKICGTPLEISRAGVEEEASFIQRIESGAITRVRLLGRPSEALALAPCNIHSGPVLANGRLELVNYLREVSISDNYHRYGNLGERA